MTVGVYGLGRFGYFWAEQLAARATVCAFSRDPGRPVPHGVRRVGEDELLSQPVIIPLRRHLRHGRGAGEDARTALPRRARHGHLLGEDIPR